VEDGVDLAAFGAGGDDNAVDQLAQGQGGFGCVVGMAEGFGEALDLAAIEVGDVGMDHRRI